MPIFHHSWSPDIIQSMSKMNRIQMLLTAIFFLSFGSCAHPMAPPPEAGHQNIRSHPGQPQDTAGEQEAGPSVATGPSAAAGPPAAPIPCAERSPTADVCLPGGGCIWDSSGKCRKVDNDCERVAPSTMTYPYNSYPITPFGRPTFLKGDPCASVNSSCAYDTSKGLCEPFVKIDRCPAQAPEASGLTVYCMHPRQPPLVCVYKDKGGVSFRCRAPRRTITGMQPPPGTYDQPITWSGEQDYNDQGCPNTLKALKASCAADRKLTCRRGLALFQCVGKRWRKTRDLEPPP